MEYFNCSQLALSTSVKLSGILSERSERTNTGSASKASDAFFIYTLPGFTEILSKNSITSSDSLFDSGTATTAGKLLLGFAFN